MQKIWFNYSLLRVKMKISFIALVKNQTIFELWGKRIIKSFRFLRDSGQIKTPIKSDPERMIFRTIMHGVQDHALKLLVRNNIENLHKANGYRNISM